MSYLRSAAILIPWLMWVAYWVRASSGTKQTVRRESDLSRRLQALPLILGGALIVLPPVAFGLRSNADDFGWLQTVGLAVLAAGLAFTVWARLHLGTNWSVSVTLKDAHELIRTGPYALVRHPIYTGCLLGVIGSALIRGEWPGVIGFALIFASLAYKVRVEEHWLSEYFGEGYRVYRREVHALVPGLY
ncbi:methyltransferase family protein [Paraburkholderia sp.]|uniref:methyltransferase family protein n=1 Tax=Paraburkholderia sp. TaxID=1926495 RepID=UPI003D6F0158